MKYEDLFRELDINKDLWEELIYIIKLFKVKPSGIKINENTI